MVSELLSIVSIYPDWNLEWFKQINSDWTSPTFDLLMPWLRNKYFWIPLYLFIASFLVINYGRKGIWAMLFCGLTFALSNTLSAEVMKPIFKEDRPCQNKELQESVVLRVNCGPGKSFPSAHATNHMALAIYLGVIFWRKRKWVMSVLILWAVSIGYAQVYVGVHYPFDVLVGFILGLCSAVPFAILFNKWWGL